MLELRGRLKEAQVAASTSESSGAASDSVDVAKPALIGLLIIQLVIGYEWLTSGITKVASGDFASGLAADLKGESGDTASWYKSLLDGTVIPNGRLFGVLIEVGEIVVGVALIGAALIWLFGWSRLSERWRVTILVVTMLAALGGIFMAINFHLASGANHPWLIPKEGFDETIDVDAVLILFQLVILGFCGYVLRQMTRRHGAAAASPIRGTS